MKRIEFYQLIQPLTAKLYRFAHHILPDDLQAEQLVIDGVNAFLLKEKKAILNRAVKLESRKESQVLRRMYMKSILRHLCDIGLRRASQMNDQLKTKAPTEYQLFNSLESKVRIAVCLRYEGEFSVDEIEEIMQVPRFEVIEKLHNGRFLLMNDLNHGVRV